MKRPIRLVRLTPVDEHNASKQEHKSHPGFSELPTLVWQHDDPQERPRPWQRFVRSIKGLF